MSNKEYETSDRKRKFLGVIVFIILMAFTSAAVYFLSEDTKTFNFINKKDESKVKKDNKENKKKSDKKEITDKGSIEDVISITEELTTTINGISIEAQIVPDAEGFDLYINDKLVETSEGNIDIAPFKDIIVVGIKNGSIESSSNDILFVDRFGNIIKRISDVNKYQKLFDVYVDGEYKIFSLDKDNVYFNASSISGGRVIADDYEILCSDIAYGKYYVTYEDDEVSDYKSYYEVKASDYEDFDEFCKKGE